MNYTTLLQNRAYVAQNTKSAIYSLADYISSQLEGLQDFISGGRPDGFLSIPFERNASEDTLNRVGLVSYNDLLTAMEDDDADVSIRISDSGDTTIIKGSEVYSRVQETAQDLKAQQCFLRYCLEVTEATAEGFLNRISALTDGIPGYIKEKYMTFISNGGNGLNAISSFLSTRMSEPELLTDQYIEVVDFNNYVGNVWESVWTQIISDIQHCFKDVVWKGIMHIGEFLQTIWDGLAKLVKWGLTTLFGSLFTNFEQVSNSVQGIIDLPMFQLDLGVVANVPGTGHPHLTDLWTLLAKIKNDYSNTYRYSGFYNFKWRLGDILTMFSGFEYVFMESVIDLSLSYDQEGKGFKSICDIPVALDDPYFDFVLRFGFETGGHLIFSGFYVCSGNNISDVATDDATLFYYLANLSSKVMATVSKVVPVIYNEPYYTNWFNELSAQASLIMPFMYSSDPSVDEERFLELIRFKFTSVADSSILEQSNKCVIIMQMLMYACLNAKGFHRVDWRDGFCYRGADYTNQVLQGCYNANKLYTPNPQGQAPEVILDSEDIDITLYNGDTFKPYMVRDVLPVVMHFQTISERAHEIVIAIRATVIAAVAIYLTVKIVKTRRDFARKLVEMQGALDSASFDLASDPTDQTKRKAFNKAYSKVRRMNLLGRLIGVTSEAVASDAINAFNISKSESDTSSIYKLIRG